MKTLKLTICSIFLTSSFGCKDNTAQERQPAELMMETKHCRYYCLEKNSFGKCKVIVTECDSGYAADASVSW